MQRVSPTERRGRTHTSTVTVAVLDDLSISKIDVNQTDYELTWYSGTGKGGQNRNKCMTSCRIKHIATGIIVTSQTRSRNNSFDEAMSELKTRLTKLHELSIHNNVSNSRKEQVGSGQRGDKIRTIQFQHDSAIDHRTGKRITAEQYMKGDIDKLW